MRFVGAPHSSHQWANCSWGQTFPPGDVSRVCYHKAISFNSISTSFPIYWWWTSWRRKSLSSMSWAGSGERLFPPHSQGNWLQNKGFEAITYTAWRHLWERELSYSLAECLLEPRNCSISYYHCDRVEEHSEEDSVWPKVKVKSESEVVQSCPTLCNPVDCSLPGSSVHGILQARILEWVAITFSGDPPDPGIKPRSPTLEADALTSEPPGQPVWPKQVPNCVLGQNSHRNWAQGWSKEVVKGGCLLVCV